MNPADADPRSPPALSCNTFEKVELPDHLAAFGVVFIGVPLGNGR